jgi:Zn-dependent protease
VNSSVLRPSVTLAGVSVGAGLGWLAVVVTLTLITIDTLTSSSRQSDPLWYLGLAGIVAVAVGSFVAHDMAHVLVARACGTAVRSVDLTSFGALSDQTFEPPDPRRDAWVSASGPVANIVIGAIFGMLWLAVRGSASDVEVALGWIAAINLVFGVISLMPGYPLDGGRVFRSFVWYLSDNIVVGTRMASFYGQFITVAGVVAGGLLLSLGQGFSVLGAWVLLIVWTLSRVGRDGLWHILWRETSRNLTIDDLGLATSRRLDAERTIDDALDDILQASSDGPVLVVEGHEIVGIVSMDQIRRVPRAIWTERVLRDVAVPVEGAAVIAHDASVAELLTCLAGSESDLVLVDMRGRITGVVNHDVATRRMRAQIRAQSSPLRTKP